MQQEGSFKNLGEEEIAQALDIEAKPPTEERKSSPEISGIFAKAAENLKQQREEKRRFIEQARKEEEALKASQITSLTQRISGKKQVEVTGEAAQKWQAYLEASEDLKASRRGETTYGGTIEAPLEATATAQSTTSFEHVNRAEESGERPAMFNLADLARQEEAERQRASRNNPPGQRAA